MSDAITISLQGNDALISGLSSAIEKYKTEINAAVQGAGITVQAQAKQACPVDTGRLRSSIQYVPGDMKCTVDTDVFYSLFIELGHATRSGSHVAARPYLYPALVIGFNQLMKELETIISQ